jgi:hypothetical protein
MLVEEWDQELHFVLIINILLSEFNQEELFLDTSLLPDGYDRQKEPEKTANR